VKAAVVNERQVALGNTAHGWILARE
jgi:hypothetical protein